MSAAASQESQFRSEDHRGLPMPQSGTYLRPKAVKDLTVEIDHIDQMLLDKEVGAKNAVSMRKRAASLRDKIAIQGAPELRADQKDVAVRRERELREDIQSSMCSPEEMRKCPSGAIGKYQRGEASAEQKQKTIEWKNIMLMLHRGNEDPDLCNIEQFRRGVPSTLTMSDAQIAGKTIFVPPNTQQYKDGYDQTFGEPAPENPEVVALRAELAVMRKELSAMAKTPGANKPSRKKQARPRAKFKMTCGEDISKQGRRKHQESCGCEPME